MPKVKKGVNKKSKQKTIQSSLSHSTTSQLSSSPAFSPLFKTPVIVGIPKEICDGETRVAATPETVKKMILAGFKILVESGAGKLSYFPDAAYQDAGATLISTAEQVYVQSNVILRINPPQQHPITNQHELNMLAEGSCWISHFLPQTDLETVKKAVEKKITLFSMNLIPRISRAQRMDVLTSQATVAGYKAVLLAAATLPKFFPLLMTAAGTITPARVVILGAGVAGLQAIATAKRLGAKVEVSDVRPEVKEQVNSLGADFIEVATEKAAETKGGYATAVSKEFLEKQAAEVAKRIAQAQVVITTALIWGRKAPVLVTEEMVKSMSPGSVIVDLAAEQGGNCALTEPGKIVVKHGVTIIGQLNLPGTIPLNASEMYARNVMTFLFELLKEKILVVDMTNEIISGSLVTHNGTVKDPALEKMLKAGGAP